MECYLLLFCIIENDVVIAVVAFVGIVVVAAVVVVCTASNV